MCAEKTTLKVPTHITMPLGYQVADDNDEVSIISSVTTKLDDSSRWEELAKDPSLNSLSCLPKYPHRRSSLTHNSEVQVQHSSVRRHDIVQNTISAALDLLDLDDDDDGDDYSCDCDSYSEYSEDEDFGIERRNTCPPVATTNAFPFSRSPQSIRAERGLPPVPRRRAPVFLEDLDVPSSHSKARNEHKQEATKFAGLFAVSTAADNATSLYNIRNPAAKRKQAVQQQQQSTLRRRRSEPPKLPRRRGSIVCTSKSPTCRRERFFSSAENFSLTMTTSRPLLPTISTNPSA